MFNINLKNTSFTQTWYNFSAKYNRGKLIHFRLHRKKKITNALKNDLNFEQSTTKCNNVELFPQTTQMKETAKKYLLRAEKRYL